LLRERKLPEKAREPFFIKLPLYFQAPQTIENDAVIPIAITPLIAASTSIFTLVAFSYTKF
jgi:hypothetical protein